MNGREMERTSGRQKVRLVAGLMVALVAFQISWDMVTSLGKVVFPVIGVKAVLACFFAFSLVCGVSWARHVVGIVMALVLPINLLLSVLYPEYRSFLFSAPGLPGLVGTAFAAWAAWTLLFDPEVIEWFHADGGEKP